MKRHHRAHAVDLVRSPARCGQRLPDQRPRRRIAEQQDPLGLHQRDMVAHQISAAIERCGVESSRRQMEAGQRRAIGAGRLDPDRGEHPNHQLPRGAADRAVVGRILARRAFRNQHHLGLGRTVGKDTLGTRLVERQARRARQPRFERLQRIGQGIGDRRDNHRRSDPRRREHRRGTRRRRIRLEPVARLLADRAIDSRVEPPAEQVRRFLAAQSQVFAAHRVPMSSMVDGAVKERAFDGRRTAFTVRREDANERT